ncbi:hypothetical protein ACIQPP_49635 [Streptomyces violaceusniger]|uniref:IS110 family transposase n=1 Tax=Streptomyces violaceusniger TaxID=68280 RepID=UPI0009C3945C|nr:IS110 family transposase [Streptomyces hygroscopicus]AQW54374.1 transposase, IS116/IS110/IS902 family [Streptomyces hygroscopicus]
MSSMTQPTRPRHHTPEPLEDVVLGVDTHKDIHVAAVITATTGALLDTRSFPTTEDGYRQPLAWACASAACSGPAWSAPAPTARH